MTTPESNLFNTLAPWEDVLDCQIFRVQGSTATDPHTGRSLPIHRLVCSDWVNVVPVTPQGEILLIEQQRFGTGGLSLEVPGGAVDPHEKDTTLSAVRELEEETGHTSQRVLGLPAFAPNPAVMKNRIHYFVALGVQPLDRPVAHDDPFEKIRLHKVSLEEALHLVRTGRIQHSLSALALLLAEPYIRPSR